MQATPPPATVVKSPGVPWDAPVVAHARMAGMEVREATVVGEAVAGYLYGWGLRDETLADRIDRAQAALHAASGGTGDARVRWLPMGSPLPVSAIAHLLAWVLAQKAEGDGE